MTKLPKISSDRLPILPVHNNELEWHDPERSAKQTPPFNPNLKTHVRTADLLQDNPSPTERNKHFGKWITVIHERTGQPVPYAFRTAERRAVQMDNGCIGHLRALGWIDLSPPESAIVRAVVPTALGLELFGSDVPKADGQAEK
jgi:hypothetical protein